MRQAYDIFGRIHTNMTHAAQPALEPGRVYRTRDLGRWSANPTRLAQRLLRAGLLIRLGHGLFAHQSTSRFGPVPPRDEAIAQAFLGDAPFVFTGSSRWNALGLGATAVFAGALVYNSKRSGSFWFGGRRFDFRRVAFPLDPPPEWFVVDLFEHAEEAGVAREDLAAALARAVPDGRFDRHALGEMALRFGTKRTQALIARACEPPK